MHKNFLKIMILSFVVTACTVIASFAFLPPIVATAISWFVVICFAADTAFGLWMLSKVAPRKEVN